MGDAHSHIKRDEERSVLVDQWWGQLTRYLETKNTDDLALLRAIAEKADAVGVGYLDGRTNLLAAVEGDWLKKVLAGDHAAWQELMTGMINDPLYVRLEKLSPLSIH